MSHSAPKSTPQEIFLAMTRGLRGRCPCCGEGRIFRAYLKVNDACSACGHPLGDYRTDDGPAYFTILIVGHLVVGPMLFIPAVWQMPALWIAPLVLLPLLALTLVALPVVKGAFLGLLVALGTTGEHPSGSELAASETGAPPV